MQFFVAFLFIFAAPAAGAAGGRVRTLVVPGAAARPGGVGADAVAAPFASPTFLAVGPEGSLFVSDPGASRVRVLHANGTL